MTPRPLPKNIGRYEVVDRLGHGGMGVVYVARDPSIERLVAIKVLRVNDEGLRDRFIKEARSAGGLTHRNIVTIYDYGEHDEQPFIVMEYVDGPTLAELLRREPPIALTRALEIGDDVCAGLDYAHERGIVHRDIKPANVMIGAHGTVKLVDFGIARLGDSTLTQSGAMIGTPHYMSPEQIEGRHVDRRADIFAVGLVLYELLARRRAFDGETPHVVMHAIVATSVPPLRDAVPGIDGELEAIVERATQRAPEARYQTLADLRRQLARVASRLKGSRRLEADSTTIASAPPTPPPSERRADGLGHALERLSRRRTEQIRVYVDQARKAFDSGDFVSAIEACEQALFLNPEEATGLDLLDRARTALDEEAARERAIEAGLAEARARLGAGQPQSAIRAAGEVLARDPTNGEAHELTRQALDVLEAQRRREQEERAVAATVDRHRREFDAGKWHEAIASLESIQPSHPRVTAALAGMRTELAEIQRRLAEEAEQRQAEQAELERRQSVVAGLLMQASDAFEHGRLDDAADQAQAALAIIPDHADARAWLRRVNGVLEERGRQVAFEQAVQDAIACARREFDTGAHDTALARLDAISPSHPDAIAAREWLAGRLVEIQRQRTEAERHRLQAERQQRVEQERAEAERERLEAEREREAAERLRAEREQRQRLELERAELERRRAEAERQQARAEQQRREEEQRVDAERRREEKERQRAEAAAAKQLRSEQARLAREAKREARAAQPEARRRTVRLAVAGTVVAVVLLMLLWYVGRRPGGEQAVATDSATGVPPAENAERTNVPVVTGLLAVNAIPWGEIVEILSDDGKPMELGGQRFTPYTLTVPRGEYRVTIRHPTTQATKMLTVTVDGSDDVPASAVFSTIDVNDYLRRAGFEVAP